MSLSTQCKKHLHELGIYRKDKEKAKLKFHKWYIKNSKSDELDNVVHCLLTLKLFENRTEIKNFINVMNLYSYRKKCVSHLKKKNIWPSTASKRLYLTEAEKSMTLLRYAKWKDAAVNLKEEDVIEVDECLATFDIDVSKWERTFYNLPWSPSPKPVSPKKRKVKTPIIKKEIGKTITCTIGKDNKYYWFKYGKRISGKGLEEHRDKCREVKRRK